MKKLSTLTAFRESQRSPPSIVPSCGREVEFFFGLPMPAVLGQKIEDFISYYHDRVKQQHRLSIATCTSGGTWTSVWFNCWRTMSKQFSFSSAYWILCHARPLRLVPSPATTSFDQKRFVSEEFLTISSEEGKPEEIILKDAGRLGVGAPQYGFRKALRYYIMMSGFESSWKGAHSWVEGRPILQGFWAEDGRRCPLVLPLVSCHPI